MNILSLLAIALPLITSAQARPWSAIQQSKTLTIATEGTNRPFNFFEGQRLTGFEVELAEALFSDFKLEWKTQNFDSLLIGLNQNRYDFVIADHTITPDRSKVVLFAPPHLCSGMVVVSQVGGPKDLAGLTGKKVALQVGTTYLQRVREVQGVSEIRTLPKETDGLEAVIAKKVDAWVTDRFTAIESLRVRAKTGLVIGAPQTVEKIAIALPLSAQELSKEIDQRLQKLYSNGVYGRLSQKYFGQDVRCGSR